MIKDGAQDEQVCRCTTAKIDGWSSSQEIEWNLHPLLLFDKWTQTVFLHRTVRGHPQKIEGKSAEYYSLV